LREKKLGRSGKDRSGDLFAGHSMIKAVSAVSLLPLIIAICLQIAFK
jgi:hypothetical protein